MICAKPGRISLSMDENGNDNRELRSQVANRLLEELQNLRIQNECLEGAVGTLEMRLSARNDRLSSLLETCATLERKKKSFLEKRRGNIEACLRSAGRRTQNKFCTPAIHSPRSGETEPPSCHHPNRSQDQPPDRAHRGEASMNGDSTNEEKMGEIRNQLCLLREENAELEKWASDYGSRSDIIDRLSSVGHLSAQAKASWDKQMLSGMRKQVYALQDSIEILELELRKKK